MQIYYFLAFVTILWTSLTVNAGELRQSTLGKEQNGAKPKLYFKHIEGLNNNQVTAFAQDSEGYVWIGTNDGLHKYDGHSFRLFLKGGDSSAINSSRVKCLLTDRYGEVWMGATDGLCKYNRNLDRIDVLHVENRYFPELQNPNVIMELEEDSTRGLIYVASLNEGLLVYDYNSDVIEPFFPKGEIEPMANYLLKSMSLRAIALDKNNDRLWIGHSEMGMEYLDLKTRKTHSFPLVNNEGDTIRQVVSIVVGKDNQLWAATPNDGVFLIKLGPKNPVVLKNFIHTKNDEFSLFNNHIVSIYKDRESRIWVCNDNGGLHLFDSNIDGFYRYIPDNSMNSITNISIRCVFQDRQKRMWIGTALEGVDVADPYRFKFHLIKKSKEKGESLSNNIVRDLHQDKEGKIWIATDGGGINIYNPDNNKIEVIRYQEASSNSISSDAVLCFLERPNDEIWMGTWNGGINIINTQTRQIRLFRPDLAELQSTFEMITDRDGDIWVTGFNQGLSKINPETGSVMNFRADESIAHSLRSNMTYAVFEDSKGNIWVGGENAGLYLLKYENKDKGIFEPLIFDQVEGLDIANDWVSQIHETREGRIVCATSSGLIEVDSETMTYSFILSDKLPIADVRSLIQEDESSYWLATTAGLTRYFVESDSVINYSKRDGLQEGNFTKNTILQTREGFIYVGGTGGLNYFDPKNIPYNDQAPQVHITSLKLFNHKVGIGDTTQLLSRHISQTDKLTFESHQWRFTFGFVALNYTRPEFNQYAYMMEGMEDGWNYVGNQREATYTHLNPGKYTFLVKASNNDGVWQEEPTRLDIVILPPWWLTWWALLIWASVFALIVLGVIQWRTYRLMNREKRLKQMVRQRTTQLSEKNKELEQLNKAIMDQAEELRTYNEALNTMNEKLEDLVEIRTKEIQDKNGKLTKFAFDNAHRVRGPLTRILGLMNLLRKEEEEKQKDFWLDKIQEASQEMDQITRSMSSEIDNDLKDEK
ncbi:ligand-binding sensor domain-containing protein [Reichenbachiella ulvae]|uniref:histidine kinase n=1 Tax=Reichenbachiella ulvae TaxID=2980104 RepID=A0ABT3CWH4_9BACT|nr:two-component regulator propeller domain-containing protein [Reichenbachiella ulvae]MCV9388060.1 hypothetical protein [Reichenbachiella ulvae]